MVMRTLMQHLGRRNNVVPQQVVYLPDTTRSMGIYLVAGKGSGKSRLMGRIICWQDFLKVRAQVILDPNGPTIDNLLDKIARLPQAQREAALARIRYIDMSGKSGHIVPWPLYTRVQGESLYETAQRFLEVLKRLDPALTTASVEGWNALAEVGTYTGMALAALGLQVTEATTLITNPLQFAAQLQAAARNEPEVAPAVTYFLEVLPSLKPAEKERKVAAFLRKLAPFNLDPVMRAMFGTTEGAIDWQRAVDAGETILLDFRHVLDSERRRFLMLWTLHSFLTYVKMRGAGRHTPIGLVIDELTALYNFDVQAGSSIFAADLDELINVLARNYKVWLTLANQELFQLDLKTRKTLLGMGTKIIGVTSDSEAALTLAKEFFPYDPALIRHFEPIYDSRGNLIDVSPVSWSIQEQQLLAARRFMALEPFHFLVKPAVGEGNITGNLLPLSIVNLEPGVWVDEPVVAQLRAQLAEQSGQRIDTLLRLPATGLQHQYDAPTETRYSERSEIGESEHATLNEYADETGYDPLSSFAEPYHED